MGDSEYPDYELLRQVLEGRPGLERVAEIHGTLCGLLAGRDVDSETWLTQICGVKAVDRVDRAGRELGELLTAMHRVTMTQLRDPQLGFQLCLPDEAYSLRERTEALASWCVGFVYGIGVSRVPDSWLGEGEPREFLEDVTAISKAVSQETDEGEEAAFTELVEYVRVGVMLLSAEIDLSRQKAAMH